MYRHHLQQHAQTRMHRLCVTCSSCARLMAEAQKVEGSADADLHVSMVAGACVPHGAHFREIIQCIKTKRKIQTDAVSCLTLPCS